jgi:cell division GTPase FtsZ
MKKNLRVANCCQNCVHCVREHPTDDPIRYFCNLDKGHLSDVDLDTRIMMGTRILQGVTSPEVGAFVKREEARELWLTLNETKAGNVCDDFDLR